LKAAWMRYAEFDAVSNERTRSHLRIRNWIAILGVMATLFAVLVQIYPKDFVLLGIVLKFFLIATPIAGSAVAAFVSKKYSSGDWLALRAGAEGVLREIYTYRTILQKSPDRRVWMENRLADVQRQVFRSLGGKLNLKTYKGQIPPYYQASDIHSDPGFHDLTGEEYYRFRLQSQLAWHIKKVNRFEAEQTRLTIWILIAGTAGTILAGLGSGIPEFGGLTLWVAVSASVASALMGWEELRNLDETIKNYSKVRLELNILAEHWENLEPEERTQKEFFHMVRSTEEILWSQNVEYIKSMQDALASMEDKDADLIDQALKQAREADSQFKQSMRESLLSQTEETLQAARTEVKETFENAMDTIAKDAMSEQAQQELAAISQAVIHTLETAGRGVSGLADSIRDAAAEFAGITFTKDTPKEVLNAKMSKYPVSGELKG
jgi:hypothetical protein